MKEIGEKFKETRESIGISIEETCEDLKVSKTYLNNIEEGNMDAFNDIFALKSFIKEYAKYLGLNKEDLVDEFNEYLFDYTSKISLDDIKNAKGEQAKKDEEVKSPYTQIPEGNNKKIIIFILIGVLIISAVIAFIVLNNKPVTNDDIITYYMEEL